MARKSKRSSKSPRRGARMPEPGPLPRRVYAIASPHSIGGVSMFEAQSQITAETVSNFFSEPDIIDRAVARLQEAGFDVLQVTQSTIDIAGAPKTYNEAFGTKLFTQERPVIKPGEGDDHATFIDAKETDLSGLVATAGTPFADLLEGVAIEEPYYYMAPSIFAPTKSYWHLDVPAGVSLGCNADRAHRAGITGKGVKVAMVDSGHFTHPFFAARGYRVAPVVLAPGAVNAADDESGHGTGESANIFAVAPDVQLLPVKMSFVNTTAAFNAAVGLGPDIITCSWGSSIQNGPLSAANQALAAAIATAVASGIIVVFSAGNGHFGFPGQHPDVISAGGTFMNPDGTFTASDYASGFISNVYPNRRCPDLCGLVGMQPKAIYIMFPLQPGDAIDVGNGGGTHPNGDETAKDDGWAAFSGTSAAAPQLAGAAALVKQACSHLTPAQVRSILRQTARDVTTGHCNPATNPPNGPGFPATVGPDTATGDGLVDAEKAALLAKVRCLGPILPGPVFPGPVFPGPVLPGPVGPGPVGPGPVGPGPIGPGPIGPVGGGQMAVSPVVPIRPVRPIRPIRPIQPIGPIRPIRPIVPIVPIEPIRPIRPIEPIARAEQQQMGGQAARGAGRGQGLSQDEVDSLEDMAQRGQIGFDDLEK
jgi:subtilisin family serine protease